MTNLNNTSANSITTRLFLQRILPYLLVLLVLGGTTVYFLSKNIDDTKEVDNQKFRQIQQDRLDNLYASEATPVLPEGQNTKNYGLEETASPDAMEGYFVFSGKNVGDTSNGVDAYYFDVSDLAFNPQQLLPEEPISSSIEFLDNNNPSDFFVSTVDPGDSEGNYNNDRKRIQRYNVDTSEFQLFKSVSGLLEQNLDWSQTTNMLAYNRMRVTYTNYVDLLPIGNWQIIISDLTNDTFYREIGGAVQPKWSPDGLKLLTLHEDGIYLHNLQENTQEKVVDVSDGKVIATSMIDVSPDGKYLVWTTAKAGVIMMSEIVSWEPFEVKELGRIQVENTEYYWPQFSPDSSYYVVQAIDVAETGQTERKNPRFEFRAVLGRDIIRSVPLDDFDFNAFFTETWVQKLPEVVSNSSE